MYLREILVPSTRFAALARAPVVLKLGFSLSGGAPPYFDGACFESSSPRNDTSCEGSGFFVRLWGEADRERDADLVRRLRFGGGEADAEGERVRCLRERRPCGDRERRASGDLSLRFLSLDRDRARRPCLSSERSRLLSRAASLSLERSRRLSRERSRRRSLERLLLRSRDLSRLPSLSRRRSRERFLLRSFDMSRVLSFDDSRGFL